MSLFLVLFACFFAFVTGKSRIAGGDPTPINTYPFATSLMTNGGNASVKFKHACGGTILTTSAILSAASCFQTEVQTDEASWWQARVGSASSISGGFVHLIKRIDLNPDFNPTTRAHDLAVLRTAVPIAFQIGIQQAAKIAGAVYTLNTNQPILAIGWGITSEGGEPSQQLQSVQFWMVDKTTCGNRYSDLNFTVTEEMACAGWLDVGIRGQCEGDSGSPLVDNDVVVAVHSWSEGCAQGWYPSINTQVAPYTRWIVSTATAP